MAKGAASEEKLGGIHNKLSEIIDMHLDQCLLNREIPENATMNIIKGFLNDNKIYNQEFVAGTTNRTSKIIEMKKGIQRKGNMLEEDIAKNG